MLEKWKYEEIYSSGYWIDPARLHQVVISKFRESDVENIHNAKTFAAHTYCGHNKLYKQQLFIPYTYNKQPSLHPYGLHPESQNPMPVIHLYNFLHNIEWSILWIMWTKILKWKKPQPLKWLGTQGHTNTKWVKCCRQERKIMGINVCGTHISPGQTST